MKCTSAIRQIAYGAVPDSLDENLQMGATTARDSLRIFCKEAIIVQIGRGRIAQLDTELNFVGVIRARSIHFIRSDSLQ
ncbi:hypothetical protein Tco_0296396 [Tanacetum coccineum]